PTLGASNISNVMGREEQEKYTHLVVPKRKSEFLGSRLAVKHLIRACCVECKELEFAQIQIRNEKSGAPFVELDGIDRLPGRISLSHSNGHVLTGYSPHAIRFGVDLERIEARSREFCVDYFTDAELGLVERAALGDRDLVTTVIWSAKEAVLKATLIGLGVDTRSIEINRFSDMNSNCNWRQLEIRSPGFKIPSPQVIWCRDGNFVLTICLLDCPDPILTFISIDQAVAISCGVNSCKTGDSLNP
ncbi:MAG: 4'-phosphopantetheinyl transferase superfamily protein, partial [Anaerolineaceae bacterium]